MDELATLKSKQKAHTKPNTKKLSKLTLKLVALYTSLRGLLKTAKNFLKTTFDYESLDWEEYKQWDRRTTKERRNRTRSNP